MNSEIAILHHGFPQQVRERVEEKLKHLAHYYDRLVSVRATLEREHDLYRIEIVAHARRGRVLVVEEKEESLGKALDEATHRMTRVLLRYKNKHESHRRGTGLRA